MKSRIEEYVLSNLTIDDHHFEVEPSYAESLGISFGELCSILSELESEGKFMVYDYDDFVECEMIAPCTIPEVTSN